jgi:hypothetical protein
LQFVPKQQNLKPEQRRLLSCFDSLDAQGRDTLLAFAEFLKERHSGAAAADQVENAVLHQPKTLERPTDESVVKAIKRLSETYYMLEREDLLDQTSSLMMSHVLQGRDAVSVIDELEIVFSEHYQRYRQQRENE